MNRAPSQTAIFLDLETTGLYPNEAGADILEIGMLAVDMPSFREIDSWSSLVVEPGRASEGADLLAGCDDYVRKMHTGNGLLADLERARDAWLNGPTGKATGPLPRYFDVQQAAIAFYQKHAAGRKVYMSGAKIAFDRNWVDHKMPALAKRFHYRDFDTNAFFILREYLFGAEKSGQKHRVLADCRQAVQVVHDHFDLMKHLFGGSKGS